MEPIKTLVVGYGLSARAFHLPFILTNPKFKLVGIAQPGSSTAEGEYPHIRHLQSLEEAITSLDFELAIIAAPNEFHAPLTRLALGAGKHVVVEKPFAPTLAEAQTLCTFAQAQNRVLSVYHNRRWDADFLTLRQLLEEQNIGRPVFFQSRFDRFRPLIKAGWKETTGPGSGVFFDLGPHLIDQALQLWGWPKELYAHMRTERAAAQATDAFDLFLYYPQMVAQLSAGSLVSARLPRYLLLGTEGGYTKWGMDPQEALLRQGVLPEDPHWGSEPEEAWGELIAGSKAQLLSNRYPSLPGNYQHFYNLLFLAIRENAPSPVPAAEALQVMEIIAHAMQSHREGRRIVCA